MKEIPISLYGQRFWYKFQNEDLSDLKIIGNVVTDNFQKMCQSFYWNKYIDIYMEHESTDDAREEHKNVDSTNTGNNNAPKGRGDTKIDSKNEFEEETRVESVMAGICEDEDNENYQDNPLVSDCDEEETGNPYDRWRKGSGELHIRQVFDSVKEFREAVLEYALQGGWNVQFTRWGGVKFEAKCGVEVHEGEILCSWRIYCSYEESVGLWMVKTFHDVHSCFKDGRCKILSNTIIAKMFLNEVLNLISCDLDGLFYSLIQ